MLKIEDIDHMAILARITISDEEKREVLPKLDAVLLYVSDIQKIVTKEDVVRVGGDLRNVMREDESPSSGGEYTDAILANAPHIQDGYVKVKQIF